MKHPSDCESPGKKMKDFHLVNQTVRLPTLEHCPQNTEKKTRQMFIAEITEKYAIYSLEPFLQCCGGDCKVPFTHQDLPNTSGNKQMLGQLPLC